MGGGGTPHSQLYKEAPSERGPFFPLPVYKRGREICCFSIFRGRQNTEIKLKQQQLNLYSKNGCKVLAEITTQKL